MPVIERLEWLFNCVSQNLSTELRDQHILNIYDYHRNFKAGNIITVRRAIESAFVAFDSDLCNGALPDKDGKTNRMNVNSIISGSCALVAHIRKNNLHVANLGIKEIVSEF